MVINGFGIGLRLSREVRVKQLNVLSSCLVGVDCVERCSARLHGAVED